MAHEKPGAWKIITVGTIRRVERSDSGVDYHLGREWPTPEDPTPKRPGWMFWAQEDAVNQLGESLAGMTATLLAPGQDVPEDEHEPHLTFASQDEADAFLLHGWSLAELAEIAAD